MAEPRELVVLYGGPSAEHEVSCISGRRIAEAAQRQGRAVTAIGLTHDKRWVDASAALALMAETDAFASPDDILSESPSSELVDLRHGLPSSPVIFPVLHGPFGEDGVIQGHFEALGVPYVGAGVLSSALCMDKGVAKSVLRDHLVPVAEWAILTRANSTIESMGAAGATLGFPLFVKPANLGSSIGVSKVTHNGELSDAVALAFEFDDVVILETFVAGRELELAVLGNEDIRVSAAGEIVTSREFYDYEDKYLLGVAKTIVPADLTDAQLARAQVVARQAFQALRVEGLARVDVFLAGDEVIVNEVNTMPGFTPISMYPMLWDADGLSLGSLIEELISLALARHERRATLRTHR
jgi:D-alanine-D-alanine ligase